MFRTTGPHYPNLWLMATCSTSSSLPIAVLKRQRSPKPVSSSKTTSSNAPGLEGVGTCWEASVSQFDSIHFYSPAENHWSQLMSADVSFSRFREMRRHHGCCKSAGWLVQPWDVAPIGGPSSKLQVGHGGSRLPCGFQKVAAAASWEPWKTSNVQLFNQKHPTCLKCLGWRLVAWKPGLAISLLPAPTKTLSSAAASPNTVHSPSRKVMQKNWFILTCVFIFFHVLHHLPVVPHKAVAEVSKIGSL